MICIQLTGNRDSSVGIVTTLQVGHERTRSIPDRGNRCLSSPKHPDLLWDPLSVSGSLPGPGRGDKHPPPSSAEVRNVWRCTPTPPYVLISRTGTTLALVTCGQFVMRRDVSPVQLVACVILILCTAVTIYTTYCNT